MLHSSRPPPHGVNPAGDRLPTAAGDPGGETLNEVAGRWDRGGGDRDRARPSPRAQNSAVTTRPSRRVPVPSARAMAASVMESNWTNA